MRHLPPLNAVRAFEAAARHLNFKQAAEELHVTASAVSHQIRSLEQYLGIGLFRRINRQVVLSAQGQTYLSPISAALDQISVATEQLLARQGGPLIMSVAPAFASGWLVPRLPGFQMAHPDIEVRLINSHQLVDFSRSDVDLGIRYGLGQWPGLKSHRLMSEELIPVCSPTLLQGDQALQTPEDLRHVTLLHALPKLGDWRNWLSVAGVSGVDPERGAQFHNVPLALEAAAAGLGVAIADRCLVAKDLVSGQLIVPFPIELPSESAYYLVYPKERVDNAGISAFREWLLAEFSATDNGC